MELYDEQRHAVNAYEMVVNNDYLVNTYFGEPDYFNLKPPLSMWAIALSYQLLGFTLQAVRIPSAIASFIMLAVAAKAAGRRGLADFFGNDAGDDGAHPWALRPVRRSRRADCGRLRPGCAMGGCPLSAGRMGSSGRNGVRGCDRQNGGGCERAFYSMAASFSPMASILNTTGRIPSVQQTMVWPSLMFHGLQLEPEAMAVTLR